MAATFTKDGDWFGTLNIGFEMADKPVGKEAAPTGYKWRRKIYKIDRRKMGQGLTAYADTVGNEALGNTIIIKNGNDTITGNVKDTYVLTIDNVVPSPVGSGIWEEVQSMTSYTDWELWEYTLPAP